jgi:photosystem II stability/assembly factor-like uncharacterized protein
MYICEVRFIHLISIPMKKFTFAALATVFTMVLSGQEMSANFDQNGHTPSKIHSTLNITVPNNQGKLSTFWYPAGPFGGDVFDIAVDYNNTNVVIAAAGSPYISYDGAQNWEVLESLTALGAGSVETVEASSNGMLFAAGPYNYGKVYRSTDGGASWEQKLYPIASGGTSFAVDPSNPDVVYLGLVSNTSATLNKVILKSEDAGAAWTPYDLTSVLPVGFSVVDVAVDPDDSQIIFAVARQSFSDARVAASFDGGATWQNKSGNLPVNKPYNTINIMDGTVYVGGGQLFGGNVMGLYKSEDYGDTWQNVSASFPNKVVNDVLIDPNNPDNIYCATEGDGVYFSSDGGSSWNFNSSGAGDNGAARSLTFAPGNNDQLYAGFLSLAVCYSEDGAASWELVNKGISALALNDIEIDPNNPEIILAAFEAENSGGCYLYDPGNENWKLVDGLPGTRFSQVTIGPDGTMYAWSNGPTTIAAEGVYKSTDGGETWENMGPNIGGVFETQIFGLDVSQSDPNLIFIAGNNFGANGWESMLYRTTDGGDNWDNVYMGPANDSFKFIFIDPNSGDQIIYAAYSSDTHGGFLKSTDGGINWTDINGGLPSTAKWAGAIVCDPQNSSLLYGGVGGYGGIGGTVYRSADAGDSWTQTDISLGTYCKISDILVSPLNGEDVYAATTQEGVYFTSDGGMSWDPVNEGMPAGYVTGFSKPFEDMDITWYFYASTFTHSGHYTEMHLPGVTGVEQPSNSNDWINIYPNPATDRFYIDPLDNNMKIEKISILDINGKVVASFIPVLEKGVQICLDLDLQPGAYLCNLLTTKEKIVRKIIITD